MKAKFLKENEGEKRKRDLIECLSTPGYKFFAEMKEQRFIKTHLPFKLLPPSITSKKAKVVYVARNPKDVIVSYYHLNKLYRTQGYVNDFEIFFKYFLNDLCMFIFHIFFFEKFMFSSFYIYFIRLFSVHWSPYFEHIKDGWNRRNEENVLFLFYEDLLSDLKGSLKELSDFLGKPLQDADYPKLLDHLHIKNFKNNPSINCKNLEDVKILSKDAQGFVRNGSVEKNTELSSKMIQQMDKWIEENLKDTDFRFRN